MPLRSALRRRGVKALAVLVPLCAQAQAQAEAPQVRARLVAETNAVHPGQRMLVGLEQNLPPGWHTYWINPGDAGVPAKVDWDLPEGARAGALEWPLPSRFRTGPVTSHGYEGRVTLLATLIVPPDARAGTFFPLHARVSWLVCKDVCIPQQADLRLNLPVRSAGTPPGQGELRADEARAALPQAFPAGTRIAAATDGKGVKLTLSGQAVAGAAWNQAWFYALNRGAIAPGATQTRHAPAGADGAEMLLRGGEAPLAAGARLQGVLVPAPGARGYLVDVPLAASAAPIALPPVETEQESVPSGAGLRFAPALLLALLGGLVLNLMPCVFPVLSIKALSLLRHAGDQHGGAHGRLHGIAYTLGVLASFALLGAVLIVLKAGGAQAGWGFQFQSAAFVLATGFLMFGVGLNLSGVFEIGATLAGAGSALAARPGLAGSFFTGVLAAVVATPCTAPFMGGAVAYALSQPPVILLAVFLSMGMGLALPYLLLCTWPALQRRLPRPGAWMLVLRQALAFPMYAAAAWLVWVLVRQAGPAALPAALGGMLAVGFAAWLYGTAQASARPLAGGAAAAAVLLAALGAGLAGVAGSSPTGAAGIETKDDWHPYSPAQLQALRTRGQPVFLNLTASWCITCLVNERVALDRPAVTDALRRAGVVRLKGDWTSGDAAVSALLRRFGRSGVPLYVFYPPGSASPPVVLPQLLTPELVLGAIGAKAVAGR